MKTPTLLVLFTGLALLGLTGCQSTSALPALTPLKPYDQLTDGMSVQQVRDLVGEPQAINVDPVRSPDGEFWLYLRKLDEKVTQVPIGTRDVPAVNPITGMDITIQEPIMADRFTTLYEDIELLIIDGRVIAVSRTQRVAQRIH